MTDTQAFEILGINASKTYKQGYNRYRYLVKKYHPDKGGDPEKLRELQSAWEHIKASLPKLPLVVLLVIEGSYERWIEDGTIHGDWIKYVKRGDTYRLIENSNYTNLYEIPEKDKVLQDGVNCTVRLVGLQQWKNKYYRKELWVVPTRKH